MEIISQMALNKKLIQPLIGYYKKISNNKSWRYYIFIFKNRECYFEYMVKRGAI